MSPELPPFKTTLDTLGTELKRLHRLLLDVAKTDWEKTHGPVEGPMAFFQLVTREKDFAPWLRPFTQFIALLDEYLEGDEAPTAAEAAVIRRDAEPLVTPSSGDDTYAQVLQANPEVVAAHAAVKRALSELPQVGETTSDTLHEKHAWIEKKRHERRAEKLEAIRMNKKAPKA